MANRFGVFMLMLLLSPTTTTAFRRGKDAFASTKPKENLQVSENARLRLPEHAQNTTNREWLKALESGDVVGVKRLIEARASVNQVDDPRYRAEHDYCASERGSHTQSPLCISVLQGHVAVVEALVAARANVDQKNWTGESTLDYARSNRDTAMQKALRSAAGPLFAFAAEGDTDELEELIKSGVDVNQQGVDGETPLITAADMGRKGVVRALITAKADVDRADNRGYTPVWVAAESDRAGVVKLLVEERADVNIPHKYGKQTPLYRTTSKGVAELLIGAKADINVRAGRLLYTPLIHALEQIDDVEEDENGWNHTGVVQALLAARADVHIADGWGTTPLHLAAGAGCVAVAKSLIAAKASLNPVNNFGTPLDSAVRENHEQAVRLLIDSAADVNIVNADGETLLSLARQRGHSTIVEILSAAEAKSNSCKQALKISFSLVEVLLLMLMPFVAST